MIRVSLLLNFPPASYRRITVATAFAVSPGKMVLNHGGKVLPYPGPISPSTLTVILLPGSNPEISVPRDDTWLLCCSS